MPKSSDQHQADIAAKALASALLMRQSEKAWLDARDALLTVQYDNLVGLARNIARKMGASHAVDEVISIVLETAVSKAATWKPELRDFIGFISSEVRNPLNTWSQSAGAVSSPAAARKRKIYEVAADDLRSEVGREPTEDEVIDKANEVIAARFSRRTMPLITRAHIAEMRGTYAAEPLMEDTDVASWVDDTDLSDLGAVLERALRGHLTEEAAAIALAHRGIIDGVVVDQDPPAATDLAARFGVAVSDVRRAISQARPVLQAAAATYTSRVDVS